MKRKKIFLGAIALSIVALFPGYWLCHALWMTVYHTEPGPIKSWQLRWHVLLTSWVLVSAGDLYLVTKLIRRRRDRNVNAEDVR